MSSTDQPLVSLITPTFNQAQFLRETVQSVLDQNYPNLEYIVINDGSTDETEDVLNSFGTSIRWFTQPNQGQSATLNRGWDMARGKYLGYLSSDDLLKPDAISELVDRLESSSTSVCVYPNSDLIDETGTVVKRSVCRPFDLEELVVRQECHIGPGALFRADSYRQVGGWKSQLQLAPDREFWMRLAQKGRIDFIDDVLASYRLHRDSLSYKGVSEKVSREYLSVLDDFFLTTEIPSLLIRRDEAYGYAHLVMARNALREGRFMRGFELYRQACRFHLALMHPKYPIQLARNTLSKPLRVAMGSIRKVFSRAN